MKTKDLIVIAVLRQARPVATTDMPVVGYRVFSISTKKILDLRTDNPNAINFCMEHSDEFLNVVPVIGSPLSFKFLNGAIHRYPSIECSTNELIGQNPIVITMEHTDGYQVVDAFGSVFDWDYNTAVHYAKMQNIANGKIVPKDNKLIISSIAGSYPESGRSVSAGAGKADATAPKQMFPDSFYKNLEPIYGGKLSVDIVKYIFEVRKLANEQFINMFVALKEDPLAPQVPAYMGLTLLSDEYDVNKGIYGKTDSTFFKDSKLYHVVSRVVEWEAIDLLCSFTKTTGARFTDLFTIKTVVAPRRVKPKNPQYLLTVHTVANKIANYAIATGKDIFRVSINADASRVVFKGNTFEEPDYVVSGIYLDGFTMTNGTGKTKVIKD